MKPRSTTPLFVFEGGMKRPVHSGGVHWGYETDPLIEHAPVAPERTRGQVLRFRLFALMAGIGAFVLLIRLASLQIARGAELRQAAEENRLRIESIAASRGVIVDRHGTVLVRNIPNETLQIVPADLPERDDDLQRTARRLAAILEEPTDTVLKEIVSHRSASYQSLLFREHLTYPTSMRLRLVENELPGFRVNVTSAREYLGGEAFSHLLGYTGKIAPEEAERLLQNGYQLTDQIGKSGLEYSYERVLRGQYGRKQIEVDSLGKEKRVVASEPATLGENLLLSIDADLQRRASDSLDRMVEQTHATGGAVVAVDPRNGEILALASSPSFDNNLFSLQQDPDALTAVLQQPNNPLFNRPLTGQYPSGSTIKPMIAAAALTERVITPTTTVNSTGGIRVGQWFFPDWQAGGHGITDVRKAIAQSVNTFFYLIGGGNDDFRGLGVSRIVAHLTGFGLGKKTGIDLPNEAEGLLPTPEWKERVKKERWYIGDTYHLAIGQGDVLVTPMQMAMATAAIANGGTLYQPRIVTTIEEADARRIPVPAAPAADAVAVPDVLRVVRDGMRDGVISGSGRALQSLPVSSAAKTGTAQFGNGPATHAWLTAFAPFDNPEIAIAVIVEGGGEGHAAALPVARDVLRSYFDNARR